MRSCGKSNLKKGTNTNRMTIVEGMKNVASHVVLVLWKFSLDISRLSALLFLKVEEISAGGGLEECFQKTCCPITSTRLFAQNESVTSLFLSARRALLCFWCWSSSSTFTGATLSHPPFLSYLLILLSYLLFLR